MSTIKLNGTDASAIGVTGITIELLSQGVDEAMITVAKAFDAAEIFTHGSMVAITVNDVRRFYGRVDRDPRSGGAGGEHHQIKLVGPFWFLENKIYRQSWSPAVGAAIQTTHVIMGLSQAGARQTTQQIITEAVQFAIDQGAPLAIGTIAVDTLTPMDEATDITIAEVIHRQLRWTPDAVTWFDYTTTPPTLHIKRRSALSAVTVPAVTASGTNVVQDDIEPCWAIKLDGVRLYFNVDGNPFAMTVQEAGAPDSFQALEMTLDLAGGKQDLTRQKIKVDTMPDSVTNVAWWKARLPWLNDVTGLTLHDGNWGLDGVSDWNPLTDTMRLLLEGEITDWMREQQGIKGGECRAYIEADYTAGLTDYKDQVLEVRYTVTNAESKTYTFGTGSEPAEDVPANLASKLYAALSVLHWQGKIVTVADEIEASLLGCKLNLSGGLSAWSTMDALVIGCSFDLFNGRRTVSFGPPPCLSARELLDLVRANRVRTPAGGAMGKRKGKAQGGGEVGGSARLTTPLVAPATLSKFGVTSGAVTVTINPADASDVVFNLLFITDYGTTGAALHSIPVMKKGDVLVITGDQTNLSPYTCPGT